MNAAYKRTIGTSVQILLALFLLTYAVDWAVLRIRMSHGSAFGSVQVEQYLTTPLKGNKAEYDYMGTAAQVCSNSLFPQANHRPCWWLERHKMQWQQ